VRAVPSQPGWTGVRACMAADSARRARTGPGPPPAVQNQRGAPGPGLVMVTSTDRRGQADGCVLRVADWQYLLSGRRFTHHES